jgi:predicted ATPase
MFISELHIQGYKRLRDVKLPLGPLTVLIGPNASGKTSILEVLDLLAASARRRLSDALIALGGLERVISQGAPEPRLSIRALRPDGNGPALDYALDLAPLGGGAYAIARERLGSPDGAGEPFQSLRGVPGRREGFSDSSRPSPRLWDGLDEMETILSQAPSFAPDDPAGPFRSQLEQTALYRLIDTSPGSPVRQSQQVRPVRVPRPNGEDLLGALQTRRSRDPGMYDFVRAALRSAYPDFEGLDFEPVGAGQVMLTWRERQQLLYGSELSDGTLRFLWLATLLSSPDPPSLIMIDEPEASLHPTLLMILKDLLYEAATHGQVLVATQSPELVSWLKPEELAVVELDEDGWTTVTPGTKLDVADWLEDYTLGQLWTKGVIGGRP